MIQDSCANNTIPLANHQWQDPGQGGTDGAGTVSKASVNDDNNNAFDDGLKGWDTELVKVDMVTIFKLILVSTPYLLFPLPSSGINMSL